jgi:hypothetical protein
VGRAVDRGPGVARARGALRPPRGPDPQRAARPPAPAPRAAPGRGAGFGGRLARSRWSTAACLGGRDRGALAHLAGARRGAGGRAGRSWPKGSSSTR